jgi:tetratricopeptide (TPR) repeat protein
MASSILFALWATSALAVPPALETARNAQDRAALQRIAAEHGAAASKQPKDAEAQYQAALAHSYMAEVALELRDKATAETAAEAGIRAAQQAVALDGKAAENHRLLGTLCGQIIPANLLAGMKYGRCALEEINKALELDPKSALAYLSRGVGNYYLPASLGGGTDPAIRDFKKSIELDPKLADAHLWLGLALRKANRNQEARAALEKAVELNPKRIWARQQLAKTPAQ